MSNLQLVGNVGGAEDKRVTLTVTYLNDYRDEFGQVPPPALMFQRLPGQEWAAYPGGGPAMVMGVRAGQQGPRVRVVYSVQQEGLPPLTRYLERYVVANTDGGDFWDFTASSANMGSGEPLPPTHVTVLPGTGPRGETGRGWLTGRGEPANGLGENGDLYLNLNNWDVFLKTAEHWSLTGNIKGGAGAAGAQGNKGADGKGLNFPSNTQIGSLIIADGSQPDGFSWLPPSRIPFSGLGGLNVAGAVEGDLLTYDPVSKTWDAGGVVGDGVTVVGSGRPQDPLVVPGYDAWIGKFWRRSAGQEEVVDVSLPIDRFIKTDVLDFTNFTVATISQGFNARFEGIITPKYNESYELVYYIDDLCRIWLDNVLIVDSRDLESNMYARRIAELGILTIDKPYVMIIEWAQMNAGPDVASNPNRLYIAWQSPSQAEQLIPTVGSTVAFITTSDLTGNGTSASPLGLSETQAGLPARVATLEQAKTTLGVITFTPSLIAIGDSITAGYVAGADGAATDSGADAWPSVLANIQGWTLNNQGYDGSELVSGGSSGARPMCERWEGVVAADYTGHITILGGTNDYNTNQQLGAPGSTDTRTIYGALTVVGRGILTKAQGCILHLLTPLWRGDGGRTEETRNTQGYTLEQVRQAVRDVAAMLGREYPGRVQLLDVGRDLRDWLSNGTVYMATDLLHPNQAGHTLIAHYLAMHMLGASGTATNTATTPPTDTGTTTPPTTDTSNALYIRNFADLTAGGLDTQDDWTAYNGAQATIDSSGLTVNAPFNSNARGVLHALPDGWQRVQVRLAAPYSYGNGIMLRLQQLSDDTALATWIMTNGQHQPALDWGTVQGSTVTDWIGAYGPTVPADCMLEITLNGFTAELRYWDAATGTRPDTAQYTHTMPALSPDAFGLSTIGTAAQTIKSVAVY